MEKNYQAARYHATGQPAEVIQIDSLPPLPPERGQVNVAMLWAPINPADLNMIEGKYGEVRAMPDVPGNEGAGRVVAVGADVPESWLGRLVLVDRETWQQVGNWSIENLTVLPEGLEPLYASSLRVNPPTAWCLLHHFDVLPQGEWILQNAATSGVGRAVIEIAKERGWKTLNFVRRPEAIQELLELGATAVVVDSSDMASEAKEILAGATPRLGLNAVGGSAATRLAGLLGAGGTLVTYGAMSREALKIPNSFLIFRNLQFRGFWLTRWLRNASALERKNLFSEIFRLAAKGRFAPRIAKEFPLAAVGEALKVATSGDTRGKVFLKLGE